MTGSHYNANHLRDVVDYEPWNGIFHKIILGSVIKTFDELSSPTERIPGHRRAKLVRIQQVIYGPILVTRDSYFLFLELSSFYSNLG